MTDDTARGGSRKDGPMLGSLPEGVARLHAAIDCWCEHDSRHYETVNGTSIVHVGCAKCDRLAELAPELIKVLEEAADYLAMSLGPCDPGCECIIHPSVEVLEKADEA